MGKAFDIVWPVGKPYKQYPGQKSPEELFNNGSTWAIQEQYDGTFFRSEGGNADAFIPAGKNLVKQPWMMQTHQHSYQTTNVNHQIAEGSGRSNRILVTSAYTANTSTVGTAGGEIRPTNYTIRIWVRTS